MRWINGNRPEFYEDSKKNYGHRTWQNAEWSDITLAFAVDFSSPGEITTKKAAGDKFIGYKISEDEVFCEKDEAYWIAKGKRFAGLIRSNPHYKADGIKLNIAGNSMITLARHDFGEQEVLDVVYEVVKHIASEGINISEIRSGGQTGIDEFGIKAAQMLGIKCSILAPKGFKMHYREGEEIEDKGRFVGRFTENH